MGFLDHALVVITGGCGDIGRATARRLLSEGAQVILLDVHAPEVGARISAEIAPPPLCRYVRCDVTDRAAVDRFFASLSRVDIVISNAAIVRADPFLQIKEQDWLDTIAANLNGAFHVGQAAARIMVKQEPDEFGIRGRILFTGSWVQEMPWPGTCAYIASKGGQKMLAKVMAQELASSGIRVNIVAPGLVMAGLTKQLADADPEFRHATSQAIPLGDFQTAESVAGALAFLCSHDADYMQGATLLIDGGCTLVRRD